MKEVPRELGAASFHVKKGVGSAGTAFTDILIDVVKVTPPTIAEWHLIAG